MKKAFKTPTDVLVAIPEDLKKETNPQVLQTVVATFLFTNKLTFDNILNLSPLAEAQKKILSDLKQQQPDNLASVNGSVYFGGGACLAEEGEKLGASIPRDKGDGEGGHRSNAKTFPGAVVVSKKDGEFFEEG